VTAAATVCIRLLVLLLYLTASILKPDFHLSTNRPIVDNNYFQNGEDSAIEAVNLCPSVYIVCLDQWTSG